MKSSLFSKTGLFVAILAIAASLTTLAFDKPTQTMSAEQIEEMAASPEGYYDAVNSVYEKTFTKDTITDAANDTLYLPSSMRPVISDFLHGISISRTSISGTHNLAVKVEESTYRYSGTTPPTAGWAASLNTANAAAATAATTATTEEIRLPASHAMNYRVIIDGSGTQSSSYVIRWILKKKS